MKLVAFKFHIYVDLTMCDIHGINIYISLKKKKKVMEMGLSLFLIVS